MKANEFLTKYGWMIGGFIAMGIIQSMRKKDQQEEKAREEQAMKQVDDMFKNAFRDKPVAFAVYPDGRRVGINQDGEEIDQETSE